MTPESNVAQWSDDLLRSTAVVVAGWIVDQAIYLSDAERGAAKQWLLTEQFEHLMSYLSSPAGLELIRNLAIAREENRIMRERVIL
jgi:hypothetical protein